MLTFALLILAGAGSSARPVGPPWVNDGRFAQRVNIQLLDTPLTEVASALTKLTKVSFRVQPSATRLRCTLLIKDRPLTEVVTAIEHTVRVSTRRHVNEYSFFRASEDEETAKMRSAGFKLAKENQAKAIKANYAQRSEFVQRLSEKQWMSEEEVRARFADLPAVALSFERQALGIHAVRAFTFLTPNQMEEARTSDRFFLSRDQVLALGMDLPTAIRRIGLQIDGDGRLHYVVEENKNGGGVNVYGGGF